MQRRTPVPDRSETTVTAPIPDATPEPELPRIQAVDGVFATAVLSTTRLLAHFYWGRSIGHNRPLLLLDFSAEPLTADSWEKIRVRLTDLHAERRARTPSPLGMWIEGESLAHQAFFHGIDARAVPQHLTKSEAWHPVCQSAASLLSAGSVVFTEMSSRAMQQRPFLNNAGVYAGPRTEDPLVPAFLYGIVLGLDEVLARDPHPKMPRAASRA